jgi:hypothetical protein
MVVERERDRTPSRGQDPGDGEYLDRHHRHEHEGLEQRVLRRAPPV